MKPSPKVKGLIVDTVCWLYILLFVYAAVSKLLDYEHFIIEIAKSPLLSAFAEIVPIAVIGTEIVASACLLHYSFRFYGLLIAFALMCSFTVYIIIILNWSSFIPCSCGGILSKLGWWEHLVFNLAFLLLAIGAVFLYPKVQLPAYLNNPRKVFSVMAIIGIAATMTVISLYYFSEQETHRNNAFIRRYPHDPTSLWKGFEIEYNSYYIAGERDGKIYLGNTTAPSHVLEVNTNTDQLSVAKIELPNASRLRLTAPKVRIDGSNFYLVDAGKPAIFKGSLDDWQAYLYWEGTHPFQQLEPCRDTKFAFSVIADSLNQHTVGVLDAETGSVKIAKGLLRGQSGEIFDTDGMLHYNPASDRILYLYYYRNEFSSCDLTLKNAVKGKTIDTISQAVIPIARENSGRVRTIASPPLIINNYSCSSAGYLFVKSERLGRYEKGNMLDDASIIDVYDLKHQTYEFSFYLYNYKDEKIRSFRVYQNILVGLTEHHIVFYKLDKERFQLLD
ncbi:MauE/DoxX family redox-associated membrane protein [Flavobacterium sp.]|uniref:DoxX family protein n=1 Tax=Flavobacterium sp. TaxID=239 RepID=UPI00260E67E5|nr:MauE/DoxX family redox-associated membrane protein [Flavobacterium sp.]